MQRDALQRAIIGFTTHTHSMTPIRSITSITSILRHPESPAFLLTSEDSHRCFSLRLQHWKLSLGREPPVGRATGPAQSTAFPIEAPLRSMHLRHFKQTTRLAAAAILNEVKGTKSNTKRSFATGVTDGERDGGEALILRIRLGLKLNIK